MSTYRNLYKRVAYLESLLYEGKQDQEKLLNFLGKDYYDKYIKIKNKITDPEYKDIYKMMKLDLDEVKDYIDSFQSKSDTRRTSKDGAKLIYNKDGWKVYRITTYEAAVYYGSNTKWCITGRYEGHEERGQDYFDNYIADYDLDGGYYFYIKSNTEKYCLLKKKDGSIHSIWDAKDNTIDTTYPPKEIHGFPSVPGVFELSTYLDEDTLDLITSGNLNLVKDAIKSGVDINDTYILGDALYAQTILYYYLKFAKRNSEVIVKWLLENGADPNIPSAHGLTPLYTAIFHKEHGITDLLLKNGADPDKQPESRENTPLTIACMRQNKPGIELLLKYGADPNKPNKYGDTPIAIVSDDDDNAELVELLVKYGAKLD